MRTAYDFIVIGCGGLGSAAGYQLARQAGPNVLILEQFALGHDRGASQDHSRIIRLSYHNREYTALTPHTYTAWAELEEASGVPLVVKTGGLDIEPAGVTAIDDYATAMTEAGIPFEALSAAEVMARWPQFRLRGDERALYQADGGLVDPGKGIAVHVALARALGATILPDTPALRLRRDGAGIAVETPRGTFTAGRVVLAADAWTNSLLASFNLAWPLTVFEEQVTFFATPNLRDFAPERFPIFIWHGLDVYGFPVYGEVATKAGIDVGGDPVAVADRTFAPNPRPFAQLHAFLAQYLPGFLGPVLRTKTCLYTMPPDRDFTLDTLPGVPEVTVLQGAAHAYKFAALIGKIAAELAVTGASAHPLAPFRADRPALTDPAFPAQFRI